MTAWLRTIAALIVLCAVAAGLYYGLHGRPVWLLACLLFPLAPAISGAKR